MEEVNVNKPSSSSSSISNTTIANNNIVKENSITSRKEKDRSAVHVKHENGHSKSSVDGGKPGGGDKKPIRLNSPAGVSPVSWHWSEKERNNIGLEVVEIIKFTCFHFPELEAPALKSKLENVDVMNYDQVRSLAKKFNKVLKETAKNRKENPARFKPKELFHQILTRCYNRAVDNEKALNKHYEAFSSQTYGETSFERMQMIIDELKPEAKDVFVDLGSGVGQLVAHVAGVTPVQKAVGIEIAQLPSKFAKRLESEFKKWMAWFGRSHRPFELKQGDFLDHDHRKLITEEATIIFINNYAFQSDLESRIKRELLCDLKDGTRIISTKPYVPLNKQGAITDRQMNDISVITEVTEMRPCPNPCSWTSAYVPYYLHTINRAKLENYFLKLRNSSLRAKSSDTGSRRSSTPNSKASNSRESSVGRQSNGQHREENKSGDGNAVRVNGIGGEDVCYGPTTRRKWHDYVNELEMQKKKKRGGGHHNHHHNSRISGTSSSENGSTAASTPAPPSGFSGSSSTGSSQLTNSSTTGTEGGSSTGAAATSGSAGPIASTRPRSGSGILSVAAAVAMGAIPSVEVDMDAEEQREEKPALVMNNNSSFRMENNSQPTAAAMPTNAAPPPAAAVELPKTVAIPLLGALTPSSSSSTSTPVLPPSTAVGTTSTARVPMPMDNSNNSASSNHSLRDIASPKFEPITPVKPSTVAATATTAKRAPAKRSYERKEKTAGTGTGRGRPRKADKLAGTHNSPKVPRLSDDARDGMELMHQMTCAVQSGKPLDTATILADMASQQQKQQQAAHRLSSSTSFGLMLDASPPFPNLNDPLGPSTSSAPAYHRQQTPQHHRPADVHGGQQQQVYASRYPGLSKFMDGFRTLYEKFFDDIYASRPGGAVKDEHQQQQQSSIGVRVDSLQQHHQQQQQDNNPLEQHSFHGYRTFMDQTPVKKLSPQEESGEGGRLLELHRRVQERRKRLAERWAELQQEMVQLGTDMDALTAECRQQEDANQHTAQQQMAQQQQLVCQQQQQQQLIAAAQAQLAAAAAQAQAQQSAAAAAANVVQQAQAVQQVNQAAAAAAVSNQLELIIDEMRQRYNQQLTAQHLLTQISQYGLLNVIAPQEIAALQNIASGAALNLSSVHHQMSPVAAAAAAAAVLHSPVAQQQRQPPPHDPGPSTAHHPQLGNSGPAVQNFLSQLDTLNSSAGSAVAGNGSATGATNISANVSAVNAELAHATGGHGLNSTNAQGQPTSLSLHQVSQNFHCPPSSSASSTFPVVQISRESTVAEVVAEVAALPSTIPRKPFRPRPARTSGAGAGKRNGQSGQKQQQQQQVEDPKKQEEIERQIQDIVAKALEVDSAAKSAEKDRKARGGDKKTTSKEKNGNGLLLLANSTSIVPTTSSPSSHLLAQNVQALSSGRAMMAQPPSGIEFQVKAESAIMQNFLSAAAQKQQLVQQQQQQAGSIGISSTTPGGTPLYQQQPPGTPTSMATAMFNDGSGKRTPMGSVTTTMSPFGNAAAELRAMASQLATPKVQSPASASSGHNPQQQQHFSFTPSSVSLAIQQGQFGPAGGFSTPSGFHQPASNNKLMTPPNASPSAGANANNNNNFLHHPNESCSPPFISLNLPPDTCTLGLLPPPTNVVVKLETKVPGPGHPGHQGMP